MAGSKNAEGGAGLDPMHQFEVHPIIELPSVAGIDTSFTNSSLWMVLAVGLIGTFMLAASSRSALVPGRLQLMGEMAYKFIADMIQENIGTEGMRYFPFIFSLFMFILFCNMLGMLPYSFTVTSHLIVTFALAATVFMLVTLVGFARHGVGFLKLFRTVGHSRHS